MITKEYITNYLRLNEISDTLSTQALCNELLRIGWSQDDVTEAVRVLRGDVPRTEVSKAHKMLYSDAALSTDAVVSLLNIHVHKRSRGTHGSSLSQRTHSGATELSHTIAAIGVAIIVAGITFTAALFFMNIGPFYG